MYFYICIYTCISYGKQQSGENGFYILSIPCKIKTYMWKKDWLFEIMLIYKHHLWDGVGVVLISHHHLINKLKLNLQQESIRMTWHWLEWTKWKKMGKYITQETKLDFFNFHPQVYFACLLLSRSHLLLIYQPCHCCYRLVVTTLQPICIHSTNFIQLFPISIMVLLS